MSQILIALSLWLHSLATVIMIGHYLLLAFIHIPALKKSGLEVAGPILSEISKRSRSWLYLSLLVFMVTGIYLMFVNPSYLGIGDFGNLWSIMMLLKHILIMGMIGAGFFFNAVLRVGPMLSSRNGAEQAFKRFELHVNIMAVSGVWVLLFTALAQMQSG